MFCQLVLIKFRSLTDQIIHKSFNLNKYFYFIRFLYFFITHFQYIILHFNCILFMHIF